MSDPGAGRGRGSGSAAPLLALLALPVLLVGLSAGPATALAPPPAPLVEEPVAEAADAPDVSAHAWLLLDAPSGQVLGGHRADEPRPVASTIKILTAMTVIERAELDEVVTVGEEVLVGGASVGLRPGDQWTVAQLLDGLVARSGNDAAQALAVHVAGDMASFVEHMAADAAAMGLEDVVVTEASGLADGNALSARDLGVIARVALDDDRLRPRFARSRVELPGLGSVVSRNELLEAYPGATGLKTGYTEAAGFSLVASAERDGRELVAVLLGADEDPARFQDAIALLDYGFDAFTPVEVGISWRLLVAGGSQTLTVPSHTVVAPADGELAWSGLPPARPPAGDLAATLMLDGREIAELPAQAGPPPSPVTGGAALGRTLADQAYAAMRVAVAEDRW